MLIMISVCGLIVFSKPVNPGQTCIKDGNLKAFYPTLQIFSKGAAPTPFLTEKGQRVGNLEEVPRQEDGPTLCLAAVTYH